MPGSTNWPTSYDLPASASPVGFGWAAGNTVGTTLNGAHSIGATTLNVVSTAAFESVGELILSESTGLVVPEVVTYTGKTGTSFTGVSALTKNWANGDFVRVGPTAAGKNDPIAAIVALEAQLGLKATLSPAQITADQHNYSPTGLVDARLLRLSTDASRTITGIATVSEGRRPLTIVNVGSFNLVLAHEDAGSTAANRFVLPGAANLTIPAGGAVTLHYDGTSASRWYVGSFPAIDQANAVGVSALNITGGTDIGAPLADGDEFPVYDLSATANRKSTILRLLTWLSGKITGDVTMNSSGVTAIGSGVVVNDDINASAGIVDTKLDTIATANKVGLAALDIDGGTDIGADIADADLFIVDDGGGGTNRKSAATRVAKYAISKATGVVTFDASNAAQTDASVARQNLLTNPGWNIWQRGTGAFTTSGAYGADRWKCTDSGGSTHSISRATNTDTASPGPYMATMTYTHSGSGNVVDVQAVENYTELQGLTITFSLRVISSVATRAALQIADGVGTTTGTANSTTGWETLTVTRQIDATATKVECILLVNTGTCTVSYHNGVLTVGSYAAGYIPLHPAEDMARCERYYEVMGKTTSAPPMAQGYADVGTRAIVSGITYRGQKLTTVSVTKNGGSWTVSNCGQPTASPATIYGFRMYSTSSAAGWTYWEPSGSSDYVTIEGN